MIKSFRCKYTEKLFQRIRVKKFPPDLLKIAYRKLLMIHSSISINDLRIPPSNRLELLKGDRKGSYSIRINEKWRICFKWNHRDAYEVEIVDYH